MELQQTKKITQMNPQNMRRSALNLTLHGPFSLNRRRRRECRPVFITALLLTLAAIALEIFYN